MKQHQIGGIHAKGLAALTKKHRASIARAGGNAIHRLRGAHYMAALGSKGGTTKWRNAQARASASR